MTTPGSGFGPTGEGFVRASAFAHRCTDVLLLSPHLHSSARLPRRRIWKGVHLDEGEHLAIAQHEHRVVMPLTLSRLWWTHPGLLAGGLCCGVETGLRFIAGMMCWRQWSGSRRLTGSEAGGRLAASAETGI